MNLRPKYRVSLTLDGLKTGPLRLGAATSEFAATLGPFLRGAKGEKGDQGDPGITILPEDTPINGGFF